MGNRDEFIEAMKDFCVKHNVRIVGEDQYDDIDEYCGTIYSFVGEGFEIVICELEKMI